MRLEKGVLNYFLVVKTYPQYKDAIDANLAADGCIVDESGKVIKA
jgi:hypothetical protein